MILQKISPCLSLSLEDIYLCSTTLSGLFNPLLHKYSFWRINKTAFENIVGKEEIACNEQFPLFPKCFLLNQIIVPHLSIFFYIISLFADELEKPKIGMWGTGLNNS